MTHTIGPIEDSAREADENGWTREGVWYGDEVGGDDTSLAYTVWYERKLPDGRSQCIDMSYYVYGVEDEDDPHGDYGVEEMFNAYHRDAEGEIEGEIEIEYVGMAPAFTTIEAGLDYARRLALTDDRWCFDL